MSVIKTDLDGMSGDAHYYFNKYLEQKEINEESNAVIDTILSANAELHKKYTEFVQYYKENVVNV